MLAYSLCCVTDSYISKTRAKIFFYNDPCISFLLLATGTAINVSKDRETWSRLQSRILWVFDLLKLPQTRVYVCSEPATNHRDSLQQSIHLLLLRNLLRHYCFQVLIPQVLSTVASSWNTVAFVIYLSMPNCTLCTLKCRSSLSQSHTQLGIRYQWRSRRRFSHSWITKRSHSHYPFQDFPSTSPAFKLSIDKGPQTSMVAPV